MPVNKQDILKIHSILSQLESKALECVQISKIEYQFRTGCLLTDFKNKDGSCNMIFFNLSKYNSWHKRILEKRQKEVSAKMSILTLETEKITRIIFK